MLEKQFVIPYEFTASKIHNLFHDEDVSTAKEYITYHYVTNICFVHPRKIIFYNNL